jgi:hypothetical protein
LMLDARSLGVDRIQVARQPGCSVCGSRAKPKPGPG